MSDPIPPDSNSDSDSDSGMRAVVHDRYGPPDVLRVERIPVPEPGPGQLRLRVMAAEVTKADTELRSSRFPVWWFWLPLRLFTGVLRPRKRVLGAYVAGVVDAVGAGVSAFGPGDELIGSAGMGFGAHAEFVCVDASNALVRRPSALSFAHSAALLLGGWNAVHFADLAGLQPGHRLLVRGAGGSIGALAVQIAKARGATVTAVDKGAKREFVLKQGADHFVDYETQDFTEGGERFDAVLDMVADNSFGRCLSLLVPGGIYLLGNPRISDMLRTAWTNRFTSKRASFRFAGETVEELNRLAELCEAGSLEPTLDGVYRLEEAAEAHRRVEEERRLGMVVLDPRR